MKEPRKEKLLRLWKIRQEAEGYDVSNVKTLEEAEHFFDKEPKVVTASPAEDNAENTIVALTDLSYAELQSIGAELGLKTVGVKKDKLIEDIEIARANANKIAVEAPEVVIVEGVNEIPEGAEVLEGVVIDAPFKIVDAIEEAPEEGKPVEDGTVEDIVVADITENASNANEIVVEVTEGETVVGE